MSPGASTPEPHSPTISISGSSRKSRERLVRASGSSSTMRVRIFMNVLSLLERHGNGYFHTTLVLVLHVQRERISVQALQASSHIRDADAGMRLLRAHRQARAVVVDAEREHAVGAEGGNPDRASLSPFCDAMLDRVFDDGLQNQGGNLGVKEFLGDVHVQLKTLDKPHFLNVEILLCELHFLSQRHLLPGGVFQDTTEKVAQPYNHANCRIIPPLTYEARDCIERVEQKVRLDLPAQGIELGLRELLVE